MAQQKESNRSARAKAAEARAAQQAAEKRRQRLINILAIVGVAVVFIAIVGGAWLSSQQAKEDSGAVVNPDAAAPSGSLPSTDPNAYGVVLGGKEGAPVLAIWEDFQCPACGQFEAAAGANLDKLAADGEILLISRITSFLDTSLNTDHSRRAANAFGCAVDAGKASQYKNTVFANQPASEGDGWTDDQLIGFGEQAGITGDAAATFEQCVADRPYLGWVTNSTDAFYQSGVGGTPSVVLDGEIIETADALDPEKLQAAIDAAAKN